MNLYQEAQNNVEQYQLRQYQEWLESPTIKHICDAIKRKSVQGMTFYNINTNTIKYKESQIEKFSEMGFTVDVSIDYNVSMFDMLNDYVTYPAKVRIAWEL